MDKDRFFGLTKDIRTGERVRVLFDMLMETIGAEETIKKGEFFEVLRSKIVAEQDAIREMTSFGGPPKEIKPRKKVKPDNQASNDVSDNLIF